LEALEVVLWDFSELNNLIAWFEQQERVEFGLILRQLAQKLCEIDSAKIEQILQLSSEQLEYLSIALLDF
jgi:Domain of unknown function (DUF4351)